MEGKEFKLWWAKSQRDGSELWQRIGCQKCGRKKSDREMAIVLVMQIVC